MKVQLQRKNICMALIIVHHFFYTTIWFDCSHLQAYVIKNKFR